MTELVSKALAFLCLASAASLLAPEAQAQIELPREPSAGRSALGTSRRVEPSQRRVQTIVDQHLRPRGTVTNEVINSDTPSVLGFDPKTMRTSGRARQAGVDLPTSLRLRPAAASSPRPDGASSVGDVASGGASPSGSTEPGAPAAADDTEATTPARRGGALVPAQLDGLRPAVRLVYETVAAAKKVEERVVEDGARTLADSGADGLAAARVALRQDHAPLFLCGVRALLRGGTPEDHDAVVALLRLRMPAKAAAAAVAALVQLDPVRSSPELLVDLLRHSQAVARGAAQRALEPRANAGLLPLLAPVLEDPSADVRERALDLLARIADPGVLGLLLERIDDKSPAVAHKASDALARIDDERADEALIEIAFADPLPLRREALAWIALAEREDRQLRAILGPRHVTLLLRSVNSQQPLIAGAAAVALAGIGFRSPDIDSTRWLEREVPATLVKLAAGYEFFSDFEALRPAVLRRLQQISGVNHASDGSAWTRWWLDNEATFRATRAVLQVNAEAEERLLARVRPGDGSGAFTLLGPGLATTPDADLELVGEEVWLDATQAHTFAALMREEGLFGFERLPGARGTLGLGGRSLELALDQSAKSFRFASELGAPWFDRVIDLARTLRERNAWQRFPDANAHVDRRGLYLTERDWWEADHSADERLARREALLLRHLESVRAEQREEGLIALEKLAKLRGQTSEGDVPRLLGLLEEEPFFSGRARRLIGLVRLAAGIPSDDAALVADADPNSQPAPLNSKPALGEFASSTASELTRLLHDRFGPYAAQDLASLLLAQGRDVVRAATRGERGLLRGVAATVLGRDTEPEDVDLLRKLLDDPDPDVQIAALLALGRAKAAPARDDIILRAGYGDGPVRQAALRALGQLGGDGALDVLVRALTGPDPMLKIPAAEGIAALCDPESLPYLMSLLRAGRRSEAFDAARAGVRALGSSAWDELFVAVRAPSHEIRREAALLLAEQMVAESVPALVRSLSEDAGDALVGAELATLTCVDFRAEKDPSEAWYRWWDGVDHRSPLAWFRAACEAQGLGAPEAEAFVEEGTREAREFLLALLASDQESWLVERARRELGRLIGADLGPIPSDREGHRLWMETLAERVLDDAPR